MVEIVGNWQPSRTNLFLKERDEGISTKMIAIPPTAYPEGSGIVQAGIPDTHLFQMSTLFSLSILSIRSLSISIHFF